MTDLSDITADFETYGDDVAAAFEEVEGCLIDLHDALEALDGTTVSAVQIGDNRVPIHVGDILDVHVSVDFETGPVDQDSAAEALTGDGGE